MSNFTQNYVASTAELITTTNQFNNITLGEVIANLKKCPIGSKNGAHFLRCSLSSIDDKVLPRNDENAANVASIIIIDADKNLNRLTGEETGGAPPPLMVHETLKSLHLTHYLYGSFSHYAGGKGARYRIVIPTARTYSREELTPTVEAIIAMINSKIDGDILLADAKENHVWAQGWFYPRRPAGSTIPHLYYEFEGTRLEVSQAGDPPSQDKQKQHKINLRSGQLSPIDFFNQQNLITEVLKQHGYRFCYSRNDTEKWIAPNSASGTPGVIVKNGKAFSHHGSDVLNDGYWHDSFCVMRLLEGLSEDEAVIKAAKTTYVQDGRTVDQYNKECFSSDQKKDRERQNNEDDETPLVSLPRIDDKAFYGLLGKFVEVGSSNSEAPRVSIAANVIVLFSTLIGRCVYQWVGDTKIHCRPFYLLVGKSGKARKGTAEALPRRVFEKVDEILENKRGRTSHSRLKIHGGGLSSGEGIAYAIRDPLGEDPGVDDKRLLVIEPEFANVLANCKRETSTLSGVIRNTFDGRTLAPLTKKSPTVATDPHVLITGHITAHELKSKTLNGVEATNGLLNRFLICYVSREKLVPLPAPTPPEDISLLANEIVSIFDFLEDSKVGAKVDVEIRMTPESEQFWIKVYPKLSQDNPGIIGSLLARSEMYVRMLAMIFAILDKKIVIEIVHLQSALFWIDYFDESVSYLFSDYIEQSERNNTNELAENILKQLRIANRQMTRTEINRANKSATGAEIKNALQQLLTQTPVQIEQIEERTTGRKRISYRSK